MKRGRPVGSKNKEPAFVELHILSISRRIKKEIALIASECGIRQQRILDDILDAGLFVVRNEVYKPLIDGHKRLVEHRKSLREQLDGTDKNDDASGMDKFPGDEGLREHSGNGADYASLSGQADVDRSLPGVQPTEERPELAPVGPGLGPEGDEALASDRGDGE